VVPYFNQFLTTVTKDNCASYAALSGSYAYLKTCISIQYENISKKYFLCKQLFFFVQVVLDTLKIWIHVRWIFYYEMYLKSRPKAHKIHNWINCKYGNNDKEIFNMFLRYFHIHMILCMSFKISYTCLIYIFPEIF